MYIQGIPIYTTFLLERYKPLPYPTHRLRFLDLQLELLDDFRIRMLQVKNEETSNPLGHCYCAILNTINYTADVLKDWSEVVVSNISLYLFHFWARLLEGT